MSAIEAFRSIAGSLAEIRKRVRDMGFVAPEMRKERLEMIVDAAQAAERGLLALQSINADLARERDLFKHQGESADRDITSLGKKLDAADRACADMLDLHQRMLERFLDGRDGASCDSLAEWADEISEVLAKARKP